MPPPLRLPSYRLPRARTPSALRLPTDSSRLLALTVCGCSPSNGSARLRFLRHALAYRTSKAASLRCLPSLRAEGCSSTRPRRARCTRLTHALAATRGSCDTSARWGWCRAGPPTRQPTGWRAALRRASVRCGMCATQSAFAGGGAAADSASAAWPTRGLAAAAGHSCCSARMETLSPAGRSARRLDASCCCCPPRLPLRRRQRPQRRRWTPTRHLRRSLEVPMPLTAVHPCTSTADR
mmetsp:Transcript_22019/g.50614  ORF Transcript_22019/g.50614 Transcript_22019/m.50614 type:complete len:238 (+) Transcript_22019:1780-2493(+)